jgi:NAD(P)-dependent dehydrogenase (short-subunit alcohol dehydrogenase family)
MMAGGDVVLITGTSSGFGRLLAEACARQGYTVYASMRQARGRNAKAREALESLATTAGVSLQALELDVTDDASVERAVQDVIARSGRIDVLINNAGFSYIGLNEAHTVEDLQRQFDTNFFGVARMNRAVLPHMRKQARGLLIYMSSGGGRTILPFLGAYSASKFALEALAESYHYQLYSLGIDTVILQPGAHATAVASNSRSPSEADRSAGYGPVAAQFDQVIPNFRAFFADGAAPAPKAVIDAVLTVLALPTGTRPLRIPIGARGVEEINRASAQAQTAMLERFGLTGLLQRPAKTP